MEANSWVCVSENYGKFSIVMEIKTGCLCYSLHNSRFLFLIPHDANTFCSLFQLPVYMPAFSH